MRRMAAVVLAVGILIGCSATVIPNSELRPGLSIDEVKAKIGKDPEAARSFRLSNDRSPMTVLEYRLAAMRGGPEMPYWILFNPEGELVEYRSGYAIEAETWAYKAFLDGLEKEGKVSHGEAANLLLNKFKILYDTDLDPLLEEALAYRVTVMRDVDLGEIDMFDAEYLLVKKRNELFRQVKEEQFRKQTLIKRDTPWWQDALMSIFKTGAKAAF